MGTWDEFKSTFKKMTDTAVKKTGEFTEATSIKLKISSKDSERERLFTLLGKLFYRKMQTEDEEKSENLTRKIHETMASINKLSAEIRALKKQLEEVKENNGVREENDTPKAAQARDAKCEEEDKLILPDDTKE